jgi:hypothetical protein
MRVAGTDIGRIRNNDVKALAGNGGRPVALEKGHVAELVLARVLPGYTERGCADIGCRDGARRTVVGDRERDRAAAGPEVEHLGRRSSGQVAQREVDEQFGLGSGYQGGRADHQFKRPELLETADICHRFAGHSSHYRVLQALDRRIIEHVFGVRIQVASRHVDGLCDKDFRVEACGPSFQ